jgi:hypothetical protein
MWGISSISKVCDDFQGDKNSGKDEEGDKCDPEPVTSNTEAHDTTVNLLIALLCAQH